MGLNYEPLVNKFPLQTEYLNPCYLQKQEPYCASIEKARCLSGSRTAPKVAKITRKMRFSRFLPRDAWGKNQRLASRSRGCELDHPPHATNIIELKECNDSYHDKEHDISLSWIRERRITCNFWWYQEKKR